MKTELMNVLKANANVNRTDLLSDKVETFHNFKGQIFLNDLSIILNVYSINIYT